MAYQLTWNRACNVSGGEGKNILLDLIVEHYNRVFKDDINTFRSNSRYATGPEVHMFWLKFNCDTILRHVNGVAISIFAAIRAISWTAHATPTEQRPIDSGIYPPYS